MKKSLLLLVLLIAVSGFSDAQSLFHGGSVRGSYTQYSAANVNMDMVSDRYNHNQADFFGHAFTMDADLVQLGRGVSLGVHCGIVQTSYKSLSDSSVSHMAGFHYGVDIQCHLLSVIGMYSNRWDLACGVMLGSYTSRYVSPLTEYGLKISVAYYPLEHIGVFAEYGWGQYIYAFRNFPVLSTSTTQAKLGVSYRF